MTNQIALEAARDAWADLTRNESVAADGDRLRYANFVAAYLKGWEAAARSASVAAYGEGGFHGTWNRALEGMGYSLEDSEEFVGMEPYQGNK